MPDAVYSLRARLPQFITRGRDNAIECAIYDSAGDIAAPSSGTVDVYDQNGQKVVDGAAVVVASSKATYTIPAASVPVTLSLSTLYQVRWLLDFGDGVDRTFVEAAHLVRWQLKAPATEADLTEVHQELGSSFSPTDLSVYLRRGWESIVRRILRDGRAPWLVLDSFALYDLQVYKALYFVYMDAASSVGAGGRYQELAEHYAGLLEAEWDKITWTYDEDADGFPDADERGSAGTPGVWLAASRMDYWPSIGTED